MTRLESASDCNQLPSEVHQLQILVKSLFEPYEGGQGLVEYALILPLLLLLLLGVMEGGILVSHYNTIANAAREGAREAIIPPSEACNLACVDAGAVMATNALTTGLDPAALATTLSRSGNMVQVEVTYNAVLLTQPIIAAFGGGGTVQLRSVATMQRE